MSKEEARGKEMSKEKKVLKSLTQEDASPCMKCGSVQCAFCSGDVLSAVALLKKKINGNECGEFDEDANFWCYRLELIEKAIDECFQIQEQEAKK